jgi:hypothetical protein
MLLRKNVPAVPAFLRDKNDDSAGEAGGKHLGRAEYSENQGAGKQKDKNFSIIS